MNLHLNLIFHTKLHSVLEIYDTPAKTFIDIYNPITRFDKTHFNIEKGWELAFNAINSQIIQNNETALNNQMLKHSFKKVAVESFVIDFTVHMPAYLMFIVQMCIIVTGVVFLSL
ncbi:hypothetical protein CDIK_3577 [Cucumispora dikerogammari]|nr:hypothetical protein CDIK_3577 [Cucumispora dikerogammari]